MIFIIAHLEKSPLLCNNNKDANKLIWSLKMKTKAIILDLDGTILNTLGDLTDSVNHALSLLGCPLRTEAEIRSIVGSGVHNLIRRALPEGTDDKTFEKCLDLYRAHYEINKENKTAPYDGVMEVLETLYRAGYKMAIVSNKHEEALLGLYDKFFKDYIPVAIGNSPELPRKPAPDMINKALSLLGATPDETAYIGDSEVDLECAKNSGCKFVGVSWGFRDAELLYSLGAEEIAKVPSDIPEIIEKL